MRNKYRGWHVDKSGKPRDVHGLVQLCSDNEAAFRAAAGGPSVVPVPPAHALIAPHRVFQLGMHRPAEAIVRACREGDAGADRVTAVLCGAPASPAADGGAHRLTEEQAAVVAAQVFGRLACEPPPPPARLLPPQPPPAAALNLPGWRTRSRWTGMSADERKAV